MATEVAVGNKTSARAPGRGFCSQSFGHGMDERRMGIKGDQSVSLHLTIASGCVGTAQGDKVMPWE